MIRRVLVVLSLGGLIGCATASEADPIERYSFDQPIGEVRNCVTGLALGTYGTRIEETAEGFVLSEMHGARARFTSEGGATAAVLYGRELTSKGLRKKLNQCRKAQS